MKKRPFYIDLFSGCGGLSLGFHRAGWRGLFAIEKDAMAFETLRHNLIDNAKHFRWPKWLPEEPRSINTVLRYHRSEIKKLAGKVKLIAGGPPCQGFSIIGRRRPDDRRNKLVDAYVDLVRLVKPEFLFFENVRGFTMEYIKAGGSHKYSDVVTQRLRELGYDIQSEIVNFSKFGVPQRRLRYILVGCRNGKAKDFFNLIRENRAAFYKAKQLRPYCSIAEAIADLREAHGKIESPDSEGFNHGVYGPARNGFQVLMRRNAPAIPDSHRLVNHQQETIATFEKILRTARRDKHVSDSLRQKLGIKKRSITPLAPSKASPTLTSLPDDMVHYAEPRVLTVREYARIQSFDDSFHFKGSYTSGGNRRTRQVPRYTQIGNAIPPLFAEQAGIALLSLAEKNATKKQ